VVVLMIRTFLSMALQLEVEGRWPWQRTVDTDAVVRVDTGMSRQRTFARSADGHPCPVSDLRTLGDVSQFSG
jgi:hypothetical protein